MYLSVIQSAMNVSRYLWLGIFQGMAVRSDTAVFVSHTSGVLAVSKVVSSPGTGSTGPSDSGSSPSSETIPPALISPSFSSSSSSSAGMRTDRQTCVFAPHSLVLIKSRKLFFAPKMYLPRMLAWSGSLLRRHCSFWWNSCISVCSRLTTLFSSVILFPTSEHHKQQQLVVKTMQGSERHTIILLILLLQCDSNALFFSCICEILKSCDNVVYCLFWSVNIYKILTVSHITW